MPLLTIACCRWGSWPVDYVRKLHAMTARHLSVPHRFVCFDESPFDAPFEVRPMGGDGLRRNLRRSWVFSREAGLSGRVVCFDLDTVIVRNIDWIAAYAGRFAVLEDFYDHGQAAGGILGFEGGALHDALWAPLLQEGARIGWRTGGRERFWFRHAAPFADFWQAIAPGQIASFKPRPGIHLTELPEGVSIVCFHGRPRPHQADCGWVNEHWR